MAKQRVSKAAIVIQSCYRVFVAHRLLQEKAAAHHTMKVHAAIQQRLTNGYKRYDSLISDSSVSIRGFGSESMDTHMQYQLCSIQTFPADRTEFSAFFIQLAYRAHLCRRSFLKSRSAAVSVQRIWRAYSRRPDNHCVRAIVDDECVEVERTARSTQVVWLKKLRTIAAILVQSWWRATIQRKKYLLVNKTRSRHHEENSSTTKMTGRRVAISSIMESADKASSEAFVPRFFLFDPEVVFSLPKTITNCLAAVHGADAQLAGKDKSVEDTQATNERIDSRKNSEAQYPVTTMQYLQQLRLIVHSVCLLQHCWRQKLLRVYEMKQRMATRIEAIARGIQCRRHLQCTRAAIVIQRRVRAISLQADLRCMKNGFVCLQQEWRKYSAMPEFKARIKRRNRGLAIFQRAVAYHFLVKTVAAAAIQSQWRQRRGFLALQRLAKHRFQKKTGASVVLQRARRMHYARSTYLHSRRMATRVQSQWRRFACHRLYHKQHSGFVLLQIMAKESFQKKIFATKTKSAVLLQRFQRMKSKRADYCTIYAGAQSLQKLAKKSFAKKSTSATCLSSHWRGYKMRNSYSQMRLGSICIQRTLRRFACQLAYGKMRKGFVSLQLLAKQAYQTKAQAALTLQRHQRMACSLEKYTAARAAAVFVQSRWRRFFYQSQYNIMSRGFESLQLLARQRFVTKTKAAVLLQQFVRMCLASSTYRHQRLGAIALQSHWRRHSCQSRLSLQLRGFGALQMQAKKQFQLKCSSSVLIQRHYRMVSARSAFNSIRAASILIQKQCRKALCRCAYKTMRRGFSTLQFLAKLWFRLKNTCAVKIQAETRRIAGRKRFLKHLQAAVKIQSTFRGFVQRRNFAVLRWLRSIAATMISGWWRRVSHLSAAQLILSPLYLLAHIFFSLHSNRLCTSHSTRVFAARR